MPKPLLTSYAGLILTPISLCRDWFERHGLAYSQADIRSAFDLLNPFPVTPFLEENCGVVPTRSTVASRLDGSNGVWGPCRGKHAGCEICEQALPRNILGRPGVV